MVSNAVRRSSVGVNITINLSYVIYILLTNTRIESITQEVQ